MEYHEGKHAACKKQAPLDLRKPHFVGDLPQQSASQKLYITITQWWIESGPWTYLGVGEREES